MRSDIKRGPWRLGKYTVTYTRRMPERYGSLGRFGGGWDWEVGFQASRGFRSVIVNLLVAYVRIERNAR